MVRLTLLVLLRDVLLVVPHGAAEGALTCNVAFHAAVLLPLTPVADCTTPGTERLGWVVAVTVEVPVLAAAPGV